MTSKTPLGKLPAAVFGDLDIPRYPQAVIDAFLALEDLTGTVSDAMDELGLCGVVPGCDLPPTLPGRRMAGPALTLRNVEQRDDAYKGAKDRISKMAEIEAHNLAEPGDVLVIEGVVGVSNMGGLSAAIAKRQGEAGAVIDGAIRDVEQSRSQDFPIWSRGVSSITGKWRLETVAINGIVHIRGVQVRPGDLVVADEGAICFIPREAVETVLKRAQEIGEGEARRYRDIQDGMPIPELARRTHVYKFSQDQREAT
ncbi:MAG: dimethylmenaquinone methyltransferase [Bordetella sp. SCN 67-23]|uniref:RraA family protein n=1 Tax=Pigmentiphaga sp. H8 TaxID=2488560 RepID=UPI00086976AF|nr:RraA family protein [Pigmentiphaga sp. H8]AZG06398.1 RraA family protein [Pigmentiphaga sp. H8]MBN9474815.1 RraA family protein [Burkholderiales bacterium]ODS69477.1 MAG: dimethylmenaquinone methyltransferase [Bordetella sp. SCN 67-23]OJW92282.1 MAG: dimethylmenaquinone methyltransferase [Burkholderiales bacterium 67-32]